MTDTSRKKEDAGPVMSLAEVMRTMKEVYEGKRPSPAWARKRAFASEAARDEWIADEAKRTRRQAAPREKSVRMNEVAAFLKLISGNEDLLKMLAKSHPESIAALAEDLSRAPSNVARTLKKLETYGIVKLEKGAGRSKTPVLARDEVGLRVNFRSGRMSLTS